MRGAARLADTQRIGTPTCTALPPLFAGERENQHPHHQRKCLVHTENTNTPLPNNTTHKKYTPDEYLQILEHQGKIIVDRNEFIALIRMITEEAQKAATLAARLMAGK